MNQINAQRPSFPLPPLLLLGWMAFTLFLSLGGWRFATVPPRWLYPFIPAGAFEGVSHFTRLSAAYKGLFGPWRWMVSWELLGEIALAAFSLGLLTALGWALLRGLRLGLPGWVLAALGLPLGIGLYGFFATFLGLAGWLNQGWSIALLVLLLAAAGFWAWKSPLKPLPGPEKPEPLKPLEKGLVWPLALCFGLITLLTFYHAVLFPEVYWDSLILYLGYARGIFLEQAFPVKVVGQVGVGLGANYPHLFELTGASIAAWWGHWSPLYLQLATPLAGLAAFALMFDLLLRLTRSVFLALLVLVVIRSVPYLTTYHTWSSNYSFVILYSAAFFTAAQRYLQSGAFRWLLPATLVVAFSMHLNYLMGALWLPWLVTVVLGPLPVFRRHRFWGLFGAGLAVASVWYIRNWIVTGNPVYAFFSEIFGGRHINPEVMASASKEWQAHGDGIGVGDSTNLPGGPLMKRLLYSWTFFVNGFSSCYKWLPLFVQLVVPGVAFFLWGEARRLHQKTASHWQSPLGWAGLAYLGLLFFYHYALGPYYLYHLFGAFGIFAFFAARPLLPWLTAAHRPAWLVVLFSGWVFFAALMPGLPWALMGSKLARPDLVALRNPGMSQDLFYRLKFGELPRLLNLINEKCRGDAILTHENRHLLFHPSIRLVHMDDWEMQALWDLPEKEKLRRLQQAGVRWYLKAPYEADHPINARLGHGDWVGTPLLEKVGEAEGFVLYRFHYPSALAKN